jgi:hypothetical protein
MLRRVALVRFDVSEEPSVSIIWVTRIGELGTLAVTSNRRRLRRGAKFLRNVGSYKSTRRKIPEDATLHSHRRENIKSYIGFYVQTETTWSSKCVI